MLKYLDKIETHAYERLVVTRSDNFYVCDEKDVWPKINEVYTPDGQSKWDGVTDKGPFLNDVTQNFQHVWTPSPLCHAFTQPISTVSQALVNPSLP